MIDPAITVEAFQKQPNHLTYTSGDIVFEEGQKGDIMYGITEGEVDIVVDGRVVVTLKKGDVFGQGALVQPNHTRAYTAVAKINCKLASMDKEHFLFAVQQTPMFALEIIKSYSDRLLSLKHML